MELWLERGSFPNRPNQPGSEYGSKIGDNPGRLCAGQEDECI